MTDIAIAYDVGSLAEALELDQRLGAGPEIAKVGLQLFTSAGPEAVRALVARGRSVFLDLKLHDIPNTVRGAAREAGRLGARLLTVHATGGREMIAAAVAGASEGNADTRVVAVTILTSLDPASPPPGFETPFPLAQVAEKLLTMAESAGAHGIVCAASDLPGIRSLHRRPFYSVTPGIRPAGGDRQDQQRVTTVAEATRLGASLLVVGRPVTAAADPAAALAHVRRERDDAAAESARQSAPSA